MQNKFVTQRLPIPQQALTCIVQRINRRFKRRQKNSTNVCARITRIVKSYNAIPVVTILELATGDLQNLADLQNEEKLHWFKY